MYMYSDLDILHVTNFAHRYQSSFLVFSLAKKATTTIAMVKKRQPIETDNEISHISLLTAPVLRVLTAF